MPTNHVFSASAFGYAKYQALTDYNYATPQALWTGVPALGHCFTAWGNIYQIVQNRSGGALAVGDAVSLMFTDSTRTGNLATGVTVAVALTDDTHDSGIAGSEAYPSYIVVTAGALATTADMQRRFILKNTPATTASTVTVAVADPSAGPTNGVATVQAEIFTGTPDNTWDYSVFNGGEVVKADIDALATSRVQGIVISTSITDNYFGVIQIAGTCLAKVDGTTDLVAGDLLIPDAAAGVLSKWVITDANATTIAAEILRAQFVAARVLDAYTADSVGLRHVELLNHPLIQHPIAC